MTAKSSDTRRSPGKYAWLWLRVPILACLMGSLPTSGETHSFVAGAGAYKLFLQGASLPFHTADLTLATVATGFFLGLWKIDGMPDAWPWLAGGAIAGLMAATAVQFDPALWLYGLALIFAVLGAARLSYPAQVIRGLAAVSGGLIAFGTIDIHGEGGVPLPVFIGVFCGLNFFIAAIAGLVSLPQRRIAAEWPVIGLRVVSSWIAAIAMIMTAFAAR